MIGSNVIDSNVTSVQDGGALCSVVEGVCAVVVNNDAGAFVASYADEVAVRFVGDCLSGREALHVSMVNGFAGPLVGSWGIIGIGSVRLVGADAAVVLCRSVLTLPP